jgi:PilZ domain
MLFALLKKPRLERRASKRRPSRLPLRCCVQSVTEQGPWTATIKDITRQDVSLVINRPFKPAMVLSIRVPVTKNFRCLKFVQVCHSLPHAGRAGWTVRGRFRPQLTNEEFMALVTLPVHQNKPLPIYHVIEEGPWWASIRNVSPTGLGLIADRPFKPNSLLTVQLPGEDETLGGPTLLRVIHVKRQPGCPWWILGCAFLRPISPRRQRSLL